MQNTGSVEVLCIKVQQAFQLAVLLVCKMKLIQFQLNSSDYSPSGSFSQCRSFHCSLKNSSATPSVFTAFSN